MEPKRSRLIARCQGANHTREKRCLENGPAIRSEMCPTTCLVSQFQLQANSGVCDEHPRKGDIPLLERDDSFSRLLARARLPGKRTRESPIPDTHMPPPPSPLPLPGRAKDTSREIISAGQQSSVFQPPPPPPLSPVFGGLGAKPWKDRSAELETFSAPDIRGQCASESLSPMLDAVVPTAGPVSPSTEPARPKRQPQQHIPPRFWSASTTNTEPDKQQRLTYNTAPRESSPARFCSLRQVTPADKWSMLNAAVAVMPPPPPVGRAAPGGRQRPARDRTQQRDPSAMRLRTKFYEKRVWERSPVPEEATVPAGPPLLSLPLPRVPPLAAPTAKRQSPTNLSRRDMREGEFSPFSEEFLALPSPSSQTESPPYGYPQSKRARDGAAVGTARRQMRPSSPPCQPQDVQSAGWSQERTSTGAPFWFNRITGQLSNQKPACFATSQ